ncbi:MAG: FtsX-like permease family protein [Acidobacteriota bacterium]
MQMYQSVEQTPFLPRTMTFLVRSTVDPISLSEPARRVFGSLDPTLPVSNIKSMTTIIGDSVAPVRFNMFLLAILAAVAMALTMVGIYGFMNYAVTQRTQEMEIRMALGARPGQVRTLILRRGLGLAGLGLASGLIGSLLLTRLMTSLLFGVAALDPMILALVAVGIAAFTLLACYLPARRATRIDPMIALRYE